MIFSGDPCSQLAVRALGFTQSTFATCMMQIVGVAMFASDMLRTGSK